jgi:hypothetical protein
MAMILISLKKEFVYIFLATFLLNNSGIIDFIPSYGQDKIVSNVITTKNNEVFTLSYSASNADRKTPVIYSFSRAIPSNWQLIIQNNLSYYQSDNAKTIIRLYEPPPSEKFIELGMFGGPSSRFWAAVNTRESGYIRVYERDKDGWSREAPIFVAHANNQGLTITNGKRIIIDKLSVNDFSVSSISVHGRDTPEDPPSTYSGDLTFSIIFGNPADSPLYFLPLIMIVLVGGTLIFLLIKKKRDKYR